MTTAEKPAKGMSVLAGLTAQVMGEKITAATPRKTLTPVEGEVARTPVKVPDVPGDFLTDEGLEQTARNLRRMATELRQQADGLDTVAEGINKIREFNEGEEPVDIETRRKQKEFEADLRAKEKAAQQATFTPAEGEVLTDSAAGLEVEEDVAAVSMPNVPSMPPWTCPDHDRAVEKTGKNGTYIGCPDCNKFAR